MSYWSVAYTDVGAEAEVVREVEAQGYGTFLPLHRVGRWNGDRLIVREKPLLTRYVFVRFSEDAAWGSVNATQGVNRVLTVAGAPARVSDGEIADLVLAHATGRYNAIAPRDGAGRFRKHRRRRRRPRPGKRYLGRENQTSLSGGCNPKL